MRREGYGWKSPLLSLNPEQVKEKENLQSYLKRTTSPRTPKEGDAWKQIPSKKDIDDLVRMARKKISPLTQLTHNVKLSRRTCSTHKTIKAFLKSPESILTVPLKKVRSLKTKEDYITLIQSFTDLKEITLEGTRCIVERYIFKNKPTDSNPAPINTIPLFKALPPRHFYAFCEQCLKMKSIFSEILEECSSEDFFRARDALSELHEMCEYALEMRIKRFKPALVTKIIQERIRIRAQGVTKPAQNKKYSLDLRSGIVYSPGQKKFHGLRGKDSCEELFNQYLKSRNIRPDIVHLWMEDQVKSSWSPMSKYCHKFLLESNYKKTSKFYFKDGLNILKTEPTAFYNYLQENSNKKVTISNKFKIRANTEVQRAFIATMAFTQELLRSIYIFSNAGRTVNDPSSKSIHLYRTVDQGSTTSGMFSDNKSLVTAPVESYAMGAPFFISYNGRVRDFTMIQLEAEQHSSVVQTYLCTDKLKDKQRECMTITHGLLPDVIEHAQESYRPRRRKMRTQRINRQNFFA